MKNGVAECVASEVNDSSVHGAIHKLQKVPSLYYTANVNRQTTDKLLFSYAIITGENV